MEKQGQRSQHVKQNCGRDRNLSPQELYVEIFSYQELKPPKGRYKSDEHPYQIHINQYYRIQHSFQNASLPSSQRLLKPACQPGLKADNKQIVHPGNNHKLHSLSEQTGQESFKSLQSSLSQFEIDSGHFLTPRIKVKETFNSNVKPVQLEDRDITNINQHPYDCVGSLLLFFGFLLVLTLTLTTAEHEWPLTSSHEASVDLTLTPTEKMCLSQLWVWECTGTIRRLKLSKPPTTTFTTLTSQLKDKLESTPSGSAVRENQMALGPLILTSSSLMETKT